MAKGKQLPQTAAEVFDQVCALDLPEPYKVAAFSVLFGRALGSLGLRLERAGEEEAPATVRDREALEAIAEHCGCERTLIEQVFEVEQTGFVGLRSAAFEYSGPADAVGKATSLIVYGNLVGRGETVVERKKVFACLRKLGLNKLTTAYSREADKAPGVKAVGKVYHMPSASAREAARSILLEILGLRGEVNDEAQ